jgi:hypothetical protein
MGSPRAGFAVTPQGAALAAWQSQFRGALENCLSSGRVLSWRDVFSVQGALGQLV